MGEVRLFVEKCHPDTMLANRAVRIFNDNTVMFFKNILQCRQKQLTLGKFLVKKARKSTAEEEESSVSKRQRRETRQKENYPVFLWRLPPLQGSDPLHVSPSPSIHVRRNTATKNVCKQTKYKLMLIIMHYYYVLLFCVCIVY